MRAKKTHAEFVAQFNQVHDGKGYRVVGEYVGNKRKIAIECPTHGIWEATPTSLLSRRACPQCGTQRTADKRRKTHPWFIEKFNEAHEGKGYQVVSEYIDARTKIAIQCPTHGIWKATPSNLISGYGCPQCGFQRTADKQRKTPDQFVAQFNQIHEGKGYRVVGEYIDTRTKIAIKCPTHDVWKATPDSLLKGHGCRKCAKQYLADKFRTSYSEFVAHVNQVHEGKGYQLIGGYVNALTKMAIKCPTHGIWKTKPSHLLSGVGCPSCAKHGFNPSKEAVFYLFEIDKNKNTYYGFGISNQYDIRKRMHLKNLTSGDAVLKNEWTYQFAIGYECRELESRLKYLLKEKGLDFNLEIEGFLDECAVGSALPLILRCIDESKHERQYA